jgi:[ribosomal protein S5]-alanine N-acetyltransferase
MKVPKWKPRLPYEKLRACSERLEVRPLRETDYSAWHDAHLRLDRRKHNRFDHARPAAARLTRAAFQKRLRSCRKSGKARVMFCFAVFDRASGEHLGGVDLFLYNASLRWANLGYAFHHHSWGRGYASEAARLALEIGFGPLQLHRIEASCEPVNKASARVARKAGLVPEGRRRKFFPHKGGIDLLVFGMNAIDFKKRKARRK